MEFMQDSKFFEGEISGKIKSKEREKIFGLSLDYIKGPDVDKIVKVMLEPSPGWDYLKKEYIPALVARKK